MKSDDIEPDFAGKDKQEARCVLREKFLRAITALVGKDCTFHMYTNTKVQGTFKGSDIEFENLLADKLATPVYEVRHSKLRTADMLYISFQDFVKE